MQTREYISSDELDRFDEPLIGFHANADANKWHPPVPAGDYKVRLWFLEEDLRWRWSIKAMREAKRVHRWVVSSIIIRIMSGPYEGREILERVSTFKPTHRAVCTVEKVIAAVRKIDTRLLQRRNMRALIDLLTQSVEWGEARCVVTLDWRARQWDKELLRYSHRLIGMHRFPTDQDGNHIPVMTIDQHSEGIMASNFVAAWKRAV